MAGTTLRLLPLTRYEWSNNVASSNVSIVLADYIDLSGWREGQLQVRIHAGTNIAVGTTANVDFLGIDPSPQEPAELFALGSILANSIVLSSASTTATGGIVYIESLETPIGLMAQLRLTMKQPVTPGTGVAYISVDVVLKTNG